MSAPLNSSKLVLGAEIVLAASASTSAVASGAVAECVSDNLQPADVDGSELAIFEFDAGGTFSAAPTAGAVVNVYEQSINSDGTDAPDVATTYLSRYIGSFNIAPSDSAQYLVGVFPINYSGGKYWIQWVDGGSGTAQLSAGWELRVTPVYAGLAS